MIRTSPSPTSPMAAMSPRLAMIYSPLGTRTWATPAKLPSKVKRPMGISLINSRCKPPMCPMLVESPAACDEVHCTPIFGHRLLRHQLSGRSIAHRYTNSHRLLKANTKTKTEIEIDKRKAKFHA
ncbi:hypothetical protein RvY_17034 [Ramazzottius varieornatus]|uniref:Uncharacterized protein n=1 Tax=Ramazzottius varieornatus TaxID=947166 RepID=A0A1D1W7V1_RAMVA|nr:hypothetical protein RvY_17034 [Ramazzottius varieornatus]